MSVLSPALCAAAAAVVLIGLPGPSRLDLLAPPNGRSPAGPRAVALVAVLVALGLALGPVVAGLAGLLALAGRRAWSRGQAARARDRERAGAAEAMAVLGAELRAGRPPAAALEAAGGVADGPLAAALAAAATGARFGTDPSTALLRSAQGSAVPELLRGLAACWQLCSATGSSLAAAVDRLAEALRAERAQRLAVEAELAGPRATAALLAVLPLAGIVLAAGLGARPLQVLLHTPVGWGCLALGVGLDLLGLWWTGRLVAAAGGAG